jgi:hypothetical protein
MNIAMRRWLWCSLIVVEAAWAANLQGQTVKPPAAYSITHLTWIDVSGTPMQQTVTTSSDGARVMNELVMPPNAKMPKGTHTRSLYDLRTHTSMDWAVDDPTLPCTPGTFSGDWGGDPFQWLSQMFGDDLTPFHPRPVGTDVVAGRPVKVTALTTPDGGAAKIWVDTQYGLLLKAGTVDKSGHFEPMLEVTQVSFAAPPAALFDVPPRCGKKP